MIKLSDTQRVILSAAAQHEMGLARAPKTLPAAARNAVFRSLIKSNLLTEISAPREHVGLGWRQDEDGTWVVARITDEGLGAIGIDPNADDMVVDTAPEAASTAPEDGNPTPAIEAPKCAGATNEVSRFERATTPRPSLRDAAVATLAAWEAQDGLEEALEVLKASLPRQHSPVGSGGLQGARQGTKQAAVLGLLGREEGATIAQVMEATGWAPHTVRGFLAGLKRKGHQVEVLERVRQVGPGQQGAKGSYTIYRLAEGEVAAEAG
ncbi:DUF3489 domain-containing protein [Sediminicoccus rosea]|uniref:DUF3489 domain-containing protein n=1 Tax=Sediminicoccus rosea TaxID=1225128 RepID=A0ABZ0PEP6_9PROT|nr:DUF3489 domain-containing protein [Sediminicoccus rosea]WPB83751.1 DUF3489 domain-containing protein [Sediminicoccus rosea]